MLIPQQKSQLVHMASCKWTIIGESMWVYNSTTHNLSTWQVVSGGVKVVGSCGKVLVLVMVMVLLLENFPKIF